MEWKKAVQMVVHSVEQLVARMVLRSVAELVGLKVARMETLLE